MIKGVVEETDESGFPMIYQCIVGALGKIISNCQKLSKDDAPPPDDTKSIIWQADKPLRQQVPCNHPQIACTLPDKEPPQNGKQFGFIRIWPQRIVLIFNTKSRWR